MCDSMIASSRATRCGYAIFGKASDRRVNEPQPLLFVPAADHAAGTTLMTTYIEVEQVKHTHAMILAKPGWMWGAETGINEKGVIIGNGSVFSRELRKGKTALLGMDILRLCLERADTAAQAAALIAELLERYGQGGNGAFEGESWYDNAFLIADAKEAWHVETAGCYWAAKRIESDTYSISNYMSLDRPDIMHPDAVKHAIRAGYPASEPFVWCDAYTDWSPLTNRSGLMRRASSWQRMKRPGNSFSVADMLSVLRTHTANNEWLDGGNSVCMHAYPHFPGDLESQSACALGAVLKPDDTMIFATGMSTTCMAPFQPFWFDAFSIRQVFPYARQEDAVKSWIRREKIHRAVLAGKIDPDAYRAEMLAMEKRWFAQAETVGRSDRQAFADQNALEAETFFARWLHAAEKTPGIPMGDAAFQQWWDDKNRRLGTDKRLIF